MNIVLFMAELAHKRFLFYRLDMLVLHSFATWHLNGAQLLIRVPCFQVAMSITFAYTSCYKFSNAVERYPYSISLTQ